MRGLSQSTLRRPKRCRASPECLTAADIKGTNILKYIVADRPVLCKDEVRYIGDPILAVAADTRENAAAALEKVNVQLEPLPALSDPEAALAPAAVQLHPELANLCYDQPQIKGDAEAALQGSAAVVEARFKTQINHQAPLEPEATIAYWEKDDTGGDDQLVIIGRSINIHFHLGMLQTALGWENMRYIEAYLRQPVRNQDRCDLRGHRRCRRHPL